MDVIDLKRAPGGLSSRPPSPLDEHTLALANKRVLLKFQDFLVRAQLLKRLPDGLSTADWSGMMSESLDGYIAPFDIRCAQIEKPLKVTALERRIATLHDINRL
jgi:hypothetical protein